MIKYKLKRLEEIYAYDYPVCEIKDCIEKSDRLAMTETRFVDFCSKNITKNIYWETMREILLSVLTGLDAVLHLLHSNCQFQPRQFFQA